MLENELLSCGLKSPLTKLLDQQRISYYKKSKLKCLSYTE
jgi:hypothetical protein